MSDFLSGLDDLRTMLAASSSFRAMMGAPTEAEALARTHLWGADEDDLSQPVSVVTPGQTYNRQAEELSLAGPAEWSSEAQPVWYARWPQPVGTDAESSFRQLATLIDGVLTDLMSVGVQPGRAHPLGIRLADGPALTEPDPSETWGAYWEVAFIIDQIGGRV